MTTITQAIASRAALLKSHGGITPAGRGLAYAIGKDKLGYSDPFGGLMMADDEPMVSDVEMSATFVITKLVQDRDGDVVEPGGIKTNNYRLNPVCFYGHQSIMLPIGVAESPKTKELAVRLYQDQALSTCHFDQEDPDAVFIYGKVRRGFLRMSSIGFVPLEAERITAQKAKPDRGAESGLYPGWHFREIDLLEWSIVGVPSNPLAMNVDARDAKHLSPNFLKAWTASRGRVSQVAGGWGGTTEDDMSKKWRKAAPVRKDPAGLSESVGSDGGTLVATKPRDAGTDVQLVRVPKSLCSTQADAAKWLEANEFDATNLAEAGKVWEAAQFPAEGCTPESSSEVELKEGCTAVVCQSKVVEAPEPDGQTQLGKKEAGVFLDNGDGTFTKLSRQDDGTFFLPAKKCAGGCACRSNNTGNNHNGGSKMSSETTVTKAGDVDQMPADQAPPPPEQEPPVPEGDGDGADMPHGAQMATKMIAHLDEAVQYIIAQEATMDPTAWKDFVVGRGQAMLQKLVDAFRAAAAKVYPDVDFGDVSAPVDDTGEEEESPEEAATETDADEVAEGETSDDGETDDVTDSVPEEDQDEEDEEDDDKKKPGAAEKTAAAIQRHRKARRTKKYYSRACRAQIKEAADHLDAAADHEMSDLDEKRYKMMKSAHRYHAKALHDLADLEAKQEARETSGQDGQGDMDDEAMKAVRDELMSVRKDLRLAMGKVD